MRSSSSPPSAAIDDVSEATADRLEAVRKACRLASYERQRFEKSNELVLHAFEGRVDHDRRLLIGEREYVGAPTDPAQIVTRNESGLPVLQFSEQLDPMTIMCVCYFARGGR